MEIQYQDLILLNAALQEKGLRCHVRYKNNQIACIEFPGECCFTEELKTGVLACIEEFYRQKKMRVTFSEDALYFQVEEVTSMNPPEA